MSLGRARTAVARTAAVVWATAACGVPAPAEAPADAPAPTEAPAPVPAEPAGAACALPGGFSNLTVEVDGVPRTAVVRRGTRAAAKAPVLFVWHGFGATADGILGAVQADRYWDDAVVVAPQGLGRTFAKFGTTERAGWQTASGELDDRDLAAFDALMAELEPCIDPEAVYSTGFSNGGHFSYLLGCVRSEVVDGIAPVGGASTAEPCGAKLPVLVTHGRADEVVSFARAEASIALWSQHNGCTEATLPADGCATLSCEVPVRVCSFAGGHSWPPTAAAEIAGFLRAP